MLCSLYSINPKYKSKKIYIWNVNRISIGVFTKALFEGVDIQGFITPSEEYVNERYMNRPIVSWHQIKKDEESIVLVADTVLSRTLDMIPRDRVIYWSDLMSVNGALHQRKVLVYGTGHGADRLCKILEEEMIQVELFCVTRKDDNISYNGRDVIEAAELNKYQDYAVIISVVVPRYREEILEVLSKFPGQIYIEMGKIPEHTSMINFVQCIDHALKNQKKIYLYGRKNAMTDWIKNVLYIYNIVISGDVYEFEDRENDIDSIYALGLDGVADKIILINTEKPIELIKARENIELAGFSLEEGNYTSFRQYTSSKDVMLGKLQEYHDPLVGGSIIYLHGKPGWKLYGKEEENRIRILVLGGSTSSEMFAVENWISKLYNKLINKDIMTVIYNGAHSGNDIVDEILRLLRDGYILRPHIVISMSGVNNIAYREAANQFNEKRILEWVKKLSPYKEYCSGVYSSESLYSFWSRNVKLLKLIAEFYGAKFFGFLQPMNVSMESMTLSEKALYEDDGDIEGGSDFRQFSGVENGYINFMQLFEHQNEMYFDICHYTQKGHTILADKVYEVIMPEIQNLLRKDIGVK